MFERILLATDFSAHAELAKQATIDLAKKLEQTKIYVLHFFNYEELAVGGEAFLLSNEVLEREERRIEEKAQQQLNGFIYDIMKAGIPYELVLRTGNPKKEIVPVAVEYNIDLIMMGAHSRKSVLDVFLGGTAEGVSKNAPCPVMIVSNYKQKTGRG